MILILIVTKMSIKALTVMLIMNAISCDSDGGNSDYSSKYKVRVRIFKRLQFRRKVEKCA